MRLLIILQLLICGSSLSVIRSSRWNGSSHAFTAPQRDGCTSLLGSREDEIAKLEDQLRQLRADEEKLGTETEMEDDKLSITEFEAAKRRLEKVKGKDMLLTEQTLIRGGLMDNESQGNNVVGIVGAAVALVFLLFFSQVPIGQENLARYSASGSSTLKTIDLGDLNTDAKRL